MHTATQRLVTLGAAGVAAMLVGRGMLRRSRWFTFAGRTVLITGGSRGLGLVIARELVRVGARVAICARTEADLATAAADLRQLGGEVLAFRCDVRELAQVESMVGQVLRQWGRLDVLINNAGVIEVGPLASMTVADFRNAMDTHCWGPLYTTLAVVPGMQRQGWGRILNIASLGGKRAVPHMIPYATSKFALVGMSSGLRTELAKDGILVTTVCPGLMRTGSPRNARFKGRYRREFAWFSVSDSLPLLSMDAGKAARKILLACQRGDAEQVIAGPANLLAAMQSAAPNLVSEVLSLADRALPSMGGIGRQAAPGYACTSLLSPSWLTALGDAAAAQNNEGPPQP